jgi:hypothetical protein
VRREATENMHHEREERGEVRREGRRGEMSESERASERDGVEIESSELASSYLRCDDEK